MLGYKFYPLSGQPGLHTPSLIRTSPDQGWHSLGESPGNRTCAFCDNARLRHRTWVASCTGCNSETRFPRPSEKGRTTGCVCFSNEEGRAKMQYGSRRSHGAGGALCQFIRGARGGIHQKGGNPPQPASTGVMAKTKVRLVALPRCFMGGLRMA